MSVKKVLTVTGVVLFLLSGLMMAADQQRDQQRDRLRSRDQTQSRINFVDENGDGINDLCPNNGEQKMLRFQKRSSNQETQMSRNSFRNRVKTANNLCDGTGPKGKTNRKGKG